MNKGGNSVHNVMAGIWFQMVANKEREFGIDNKIFISIIENRCNKTYMQLEIQSIENKGDAIVLKIIADFTTSNSEQFHGTCIDSGAQLTVIEIPQAKAY